MISGWLDRQVLAGSGRRQQPALPYIEWYRLINARVFFWAEEHRLERLLGARAYRKSRHDVVVLDTASLVAAYAPAIRLCRLNSGNTFPMPHRREVADFCTIEDYPCRRSGKPVKPVVEVTVDYAVPDIARHVVEVRSG